MPQARLARLEWSGTDVPQPKKAPTPETTKGAVQECAARVQNETMPFEVFSPDNTELMDALTKIGRRFKVSAPVVSYKDSYRAYGRSHESGQALFTHFHAMEHVFLGMGTTYRDAFWAYVRDTMKKHENVAEIATAAHTHALTALVKALLHKEAAGK